MAPVTRRSTRSSLTLAPNSSSTTALKKSRGTLQARASKVKIVWYGGENAHQDVCIRLVRDTINNEVDDGHTLASLMVHSSRLETCSSYFAAALSHRWTSKRKQNPEELTFHVHGDVRLYTDCFSRMYKPLVVGFKSVEYSLRLLPVATHLEYDDLMSSICLYLSVCPWSDEEEMRIQSSVLSEDFPRGHVQDLLERLDSHLTRDDLRPLITKCMEWGMNSLDFRASSMESATQARELLDHILVTARRQERSPTPTFAQEAVCVINEEFKLLLEAANVEVETADSMEDNPGLVSTLDTICQVLETLLVTGMAHEAVKGFSQYTSFPKLLGDAATSDLDDLDVLIVLDAFTWTVVKIVRELVKSDLVERSVRVEESVWDALLLNWLPLLDWLHRNDDDAFDEALSVQCRGVYEQVKRGLLCIRPSSEELKEIIDKVLALE